jgi:hypothetical protein
MSSRRRVLRVSVVVAVLVSALLAIAWAPGHFTDRIADRHGVVRHDGLELRVIGVDRRRTRARAQRGGMRFLVALQIANRAKRAAYDWRAGSVFVVDDRGRIYHADEARDGAPRQRPIRPGSSRIVQLTFALPRDALHPALKFWDGIAFGDVFNGLAYARTRVPLDESGAPSARVRRASSHRE